MPDSGAHGAGGDQVGEGPAPAAPQRLATTMDAAWVRFARDGDPGWARYDLERRATMRFDTSSSVVENPYARGWQLRAGVR